MLTPPEDQQFMDVDLKWSLWSDSKDHWIGYSDRADVWNAMVAAFHGRGPWICVWTAPRKEIRYGRVNISHHCADGYFRTEWDDPAELADTLGLTKGLNDDEWEDWLNSDEYQAFCESLPYNEHSCNGEPGVLVEFEHNADTFDELMKLIDESESELIQESERQWNELVEMYEKPLTA